MKREQRFWEVDLRELLKSWLADISAFLLTALGFVAIAIPVLIASFFLWWKAGFPPIIF